MTGRTDAPDDFEPAATLFERIANRLGFERLQAKLPTNPHPLVCWGIGFFVVDVVVLQAFKEFAGHRATFFTNPAWVIQPIFGLCAPFVLVYLHRRYGAVLDEIDVTARTSNPAAFATLAPLGLRALFYTVLVSYSVWKFLVDTGVSTVTQIGGLAELIGVAVVLPLGYGVIFAEFLATYVGIMIAFPRKIRRTDFKLNFLDPEGLGGLRPAGELMKSAYYFVVLGLIGYAVQLYGPSIVDGLTQTPYPDPGFTTNLLFTLVWLLAIGTMVYGLAQVHWFMKRVKREELTRLDREGRELVEDPFDMRNFEIRDETEYEEIRRRMEHINNTQEYPTTFTMWFQILIGLVLPKAVQVAFSAL